MILEEECVEEMEEEEVEVEEMEEEEEEVEVEEEVYAEDEGSSDSSVVELLPAEYELILEARRIT